MKKFLSSLLVASFLSTSLIGLPEPTGFQSVQEPFDQLERAIQESQGFLLNFDVNGDTVTFIGLGPNHDQTHYRERTSHAGPMRPRRNAVHGRRNAVPYVRSETQEQMRHLAATERGGSNSLQTRFVARFSRVEEEEAPRGPVQNPVFDAREIIEARRTLRNQTQQSMHVVQNDEHAVVPEAPDAQGSMNSLFENVQNGQEEQS